MSDNMDNVPILKDGTANPNFLMTRKQAIAVLQVIRSGNMKSDGDMLNKIICDKAISLAIRGLERQNGSWEYLKEHITEMRDADGELNQTKTCQFILNLMKLIEIEGDSE